MVDDNELREEMRRAHIANEYREAADRAAAGKTQTRADIEAAAAKAERERVLAALAQELDEFGMCADAEDRAAFVVWFSERLEAARKNEAKSHG